MANYEAVEQAAADVRRYVATGEHPWPPMEEDNGYRDMTPKEVFAFCYSGHRYNAGALLRASEDGPHGRIWH
jgi:hypothetical protein